MANMRMTREPWEQGKKQRRAEGETCEAASYNRWAKRKNSQVHTARGWAEMEGGTRGPWGQGTRGASRRHGARTIKEGKAMA